MVRVKETTGRPKADIDWDEVDKLLITGCSGAEVASYMGLNKATIYDRCLKDHGIPFSEYSQHRYEKGDSILRAHQFAKAIGKTVKGDNTLLIWLGKTRLKQVEKKDPEEHAITIRHVDATSDRSSPQVSMQAVSARSVESDK